MGDLSLDSAVHPIEGRPGRYRTHIHPDWRIWGPNGGYLAVLALRAVGAEARVDRPVAFSGHFLSVGDFREAEIQVTPIRVGRRAESFGVQIEQDGKALFSGMVRTAAEVPGLEHDISVMPDVPHYETLKDLPDLLSEEEREQGPPFPFWLNFDVRPLWPERVREEPRAREPIFQEWFRYKERATFDDPWLDAARSLILIDTCSWIAACQPHPNADYQAPNMDVTVWFHQSEPKAEWLLGDIRCDIAKGGLMGTHARIWSETGKLLATGGAQLFCMPRTQPG